MTKIYFSILIFTLVFYHTTSIAQKTFNIKIQIDSTINPEKLKFQYEDGKQTNYLPSPVHNQKTITLKGKYFSYLAGLTISYTNKDNNIYLSTYFLSEKPASMCLYYKDNDYLSILSKNRKNVQDIFDSTSNLTYKELIHYNKIAFLNNYEFTQKYQSQLNSNDSLHHVYMQMLRNTDINTMQFLKEHSDDYFSFWYFEHEFITTLHDRTPDTPYLVQQLAFLKQAFPKKFIESIEGKELIKTYKGLIYPLKKYELAPLINATAIDGQRINLDKFKGKIVLLDFWATWCGPCMAELPFLKQIRNKYPKSTLVMIGISQDKDLNKLKKVVFDQKMNWLQYFDRETDVSRLYGVNQFPTLILLNRNGQIIYKSDYIKDDDMNKIPNIINLNL